MLEAVAAAIAGALITTASASGIAAARKSGETRDAVLVLTTKVEALDARVVAGLSDVREQGHRIQALEKSTVHLESRVTALEAGVIDRRGR